MLHKRLLTEAEVALVIVIFFIPVKGKEEEKTSDVKSIKEAVQETALKILKKKKSKGSKPYLTQCIEKWGQKESRNEQIEEEIRTSIAVHSPQKSTKNHALLEAAGPSHVAINAISANMDSFSSSRTATLKKQPSHMEAAHFGDLECQCRSCLNYQTQETKSSLSKTLEQVLHDTVVLPYFIQFMELRRMEHLVKFWLEAESFHSTTWSRIRAHSLNTVKQSSLAEPVSPSKKHKTTASFLTDSLDKRLEDYGSAQLFMTHSEGIDLNNRTNYTQNYLLLSQECDSAHSLHLEMARAPAHQVSMETQESSSTLTVASRNSPASPLKELSGKLMKSIEQDAVNTFTKYISPDAAKPIPITEAMRNDIIAKICGEDGQVKSAFPFTLYSSIPASNYKCWGPVCRK
ncbi:A-kinase anchor protein 10, mitochondrial [Saguinus oedipus]|uniref:A-kinase anchor protein 10, mitochondrial n=1 Tax=Saguinus oedipus TaxID=9490 RepID=A0ABQ9VPH2_SAGOE|nr:A-kinase anchor protein 10, mitochondrial [Saguinus oedipus]